MRLEGFLLLLWAKLFRCRVAKKDVKPKKCLPVVSVLVILSVIVKDIQTMIN